MKKLLNIFILSLCCILASCSDDDSPVGGTLTIASTDLDFTAGGGEGSIVVAGTGAITAVSDKDWCTVSVEGMTVHVTVATSDDITSRTAVVTISSGIESVEVPVVQTGLVANIGGSDRCFGYAGGTFTIETNTTYTVTIPEDAQEWISYTEETDESGRKTQLVFNVGSATALRGTEISLQLGGKEHKISVVQIEADDIVGTWNCSYLSGNLEQDLSGEIMIADTQDGLMMSELSLGTGLPITLEDGQFSLLGGVIIGTWQNYYVATGITLNGSSSLSGTISGTLHYADGTMTITIGDASSYFSLYAINPSTMSSEGWIEQYHNFTISKQIQ